VSLFVSCQPEEKRDWLYRLVIVSGHSGFIPARAHSPPVPPPALALANLVRHAVKYFAIPTWRPPKAWGRNHLLPLLYSHQKALGVRKIGATRGAISRRCRGHFVNRCMPGWRFLMRLKQDWTCQKYQAGCLSYETAGSPFLASDFCFLFSNHTSWPVPGRR
jgi:hypothetical protein